MLQRLGIVVLVVAVAAGTAWWLVSSRTPAAPGAPDAQSAGGVVAANSSGLPAEVAPPAGAKPGDQLTGEILKSQTELRAALANTAQGKIPREEGIRRIEALFDKLAEAQHEIPTDTFDPKAIVAKVGADPAALEQWMRTETWLAPYRGSLRGPVGVLLDRTGNSLDRALLLAELMKIARFEVRLARAELTDAQAVAVRGSAALPPADLPVRLRGTSGGEVSPALIGEVSRILGADEAQVAERVRSVTATRTRVSTEAQQRIAAQVNVLAAAAPSTGGSDEGGPAALGDHWWVQWRNGSLWEDLDPAWPEAGDVPHPAAARTLRPADVRPEDLHAVQIRVVAEVLRDGKLSELELMRHNFAASRVIGERITLQHVPMSWPDSVNLSAEADPLAKIAELARAEREWLPLLLVGGGQVMKYSINAEGETLDVADPHANATRLGRAAGKASKKLEGVTGLFDSLPGAPQQKPADAPKTPRAPARLTAEWIEYTIRVPGQAPQTIRREVFDVVGPALRAAGVPATFDLDETQRFRRSLALIEQIDVLPAVAQVSPAFVQHLIVSRTLAARPLVIAALRADEDAPPASLNEQLARVRPLPGPLYDFALMRSEWSPVAADMYFHRPNVVTYRKRLASSDGRTLQSREGFDIVTNQIGVHARPGVSAYAVRLRQGIVDTNAEALLVSGCGGAAPDCGRPMNTAELFAASDQQRRWLVIRPGASAAGLQISADARARIAADLAAGFIVIAPESPVTLPGGAGFGWWRVDAKSGETLGIGEHGDGQAYVETLIKFAIQSVLFAACIKQVATDRGGASWARALNLIGCSIGLFTGLSGIWAGALNMSTAGMVLEGIGAVPALISLFM